MLVSWKKGCDKPRQHIKKQRHHFVAKGLSSQSYRFPSSNIQIWELGHKESWAPKNWCFQIVVPEKTLESLLDCKEIKPVNPKGNQPWIFIRRTDAEAEIPILWLPNVKNWLLGRDPDAGIDLRQEEKVKTEDEMVGWHHQLSGHGFGCTLGIGDGQGRLVRYSPWCCRVGHDWVTELNWNMWMITVWVFIKN